MAKKGVEIFQPKITRNDRFAQMSHQEKIIEQKKKEIQLKLEAKQKATNPETKTTTSQSTTTQVVSTATTTTPPPTNNNSNNQTKSKSTKDTMKKSLNVFNMFSNDGSFLDQFKQIKDKRHDNNKYKSFNKSNSDKSSNSRWLPRRRSASPKQPKRRSNFDQKITINTTFTPPPTIIQQNGIIGQPLMKNLNNLMHPPPLNSFPEPSVLLNVPPPQLIAPNTLLLPPTSQNVLVSSAVSSLGTVTVLTQENTTFSPCTVELSTIPPPHPIQVQNIPQPEPINALNIPPPAPIQVQNIPTPTTIQLNEIPPPKPLDLLQIPTPLDDKQAADADFSIPPPNLPDNVVLCVPPPTAAPPNAPPPPPPPSIPSLMAQAILPPQLANVSCPPPTMLSSPPPPLPPPPPTVLNTAQMPPMNVPPPTAAPQALFDINAGTHDYESMVTLARMVAQCGSSFEDVVKQRKIQEPNHWFLFHRDSSAYRQYKMLVDQFKCELNRQGETLYKPEDLYEPEMATDDYYEMKPAQKRKRKSRWGEKETNMPPPAVHDGPVMLSKVTRTDPNLLLYVMNTFGSTNLSDEDWIKAEDHYKINLLYQDMLKKREQVERLKSSGKNSYDYDSDEEVDGGTWEHKLRDKEMMATQLWAQELTRQAEGKHHIGDFLPPDEFKRFMEKSSAAKDGRQLNFSDYKEFKIKEDNIGFKMLQKLGWNEGQGLGTNNAGIVEPVNKAASREQHQGLGLNQTEDNEDEYESYRKRMMLAYRFRPNPLNNPRRPYY